MNLKEQFVAAWEREFPTTLKVLKAFPADKGDFKPHERSHSAKAPGVAFPTGASRHRASAGRNFRDTAEVSSRAGRMGRRREHLRKDAQ